jgi:hypothetical protein
VLHLLNIYADFDGRNWYLRPQQVLDPILTCIFIMDGRFQRCLESVGVTGIKIYMSSGWCYCPLLMLIPTLVLVGNTTNTNL